MASRKLRLFDNGEGTQLIRGNGWEIRVVKGKRSFAFISDGVLYEQCYGALHALEMGDGELTVLDTEWRRLENVSFGPKVRSVARLLATPRNIVERPMET